VIDLDCSVKHVDIIFFNIPLH